MGRDVRISPVGSCRMHRDVTLIAVFVLLLLVQSAGAGGTRTARADSRVFQTTRTFELDTGRATRTFTLRERGGVILINRLTVSHGVRVFVDARIPGLAGARVSSWMNSNDPSLACRSHGALDVCTQGEEWCPMPQAVWQFRLVKLSGRQDRCASTTSLPRRRQSVRSRAAVAGRC